MVAVQRLAGDLISLLFPELCNACGASLYQGEREICITCLFDLPYTDFHIYRDNPVAKQFWGRISCEMVMAMLYFKKGTKVQNLIHSLKYKGKKEVGIRLGQLLADRLKEGNKITDVDLIIPVPLHPQKEKIRGYNQSEQIAIGVAQLLDLPTSTSNLLRNKPTDSQTKKSRYTRYENMQTVFSVYKPEQLKNLHILLVDDVITTGATLEACGNALLNIGIKKLSIASIAFAE